MGRGKENTSEPQSLEKDRYGIDGIRRWWLTRASRRLQACSSQLGLLDLLKNYKVDSSFLLPHSLVYPSWSIAIDSRTLETLGTHASWNVEGRSPRKEGFEHGSLFWSFLVV